MTNSEVEVENSNSSVFDNLPLSIGIYDTPSNPGALPNIFPFNLDTDFTLGLLTQKNTPELESLLTNVYRLGNEMGTPLSESDLGIGYARDFLDYIDASTGEIGRALEIGAGVGYLSSEIREKGWAVDSIEPGNGYQHHWEKYDIEVINDFFPSKHINGLYDLIFFYAVLEHVADIHEFLGHVIRHLAPGGKIILSVPDCTEEIVNGDPSILLHEHYQYFTASSLRRTLRFSGLDAVVSSSGYGRTLYAVAKIGSTVCSDDVDDLEKKALYKYAEKCKSFIGIVRGKIYQITNTGSLGIYCPGRALAVLPTDVDLLFFDDAPELHGKYYPPFNNQIKSREELINANNFNSGSQP